MPNYAASILAEAQLILNERFAAPEKRLKTAGVIGSFLKNTQMAIPNIGDLRTKEERPEKAYFANRTKRASIAGRTHNHSGTVGDTTEIDLSYQTFGDVAQTSLKRADNNIMSAAQMLANELENVFKNIHESMDAAALAYLSTNKTLVNGATKNGAYNAVNDVFEILAADAEKFFQYGKSMLRQNYYTGMADVILDPVLFAQAEFLAQQGQGNATNYGYQFSQMMLSESVQLEDADYLNGIGYFIPEGTIGAVNWIPKQNRDGKGDFDSQLGGFSTIVDPYTGLPFAIHGYTERADTSASGGDAQDEVVEWEISTDISFNNSPLSVADESTIFEVGQL